jgi:hypothetical protein
LNSHRVAAVAFHFVDEGFDGVRFASVDLTYVLSDGALGEVYLVVDARGEGEMVLAIDGEIVGAATTGTRPVFLNPAVDPDLMAELLSLLAREDPECLIPLEFECSDFGRKATAATRWLFKTATYVTAAACCTLSSGVACVVCSTGALVGGDYVDERFANHCD